jgi:hypothetical protein
MAIQNLSCISYKTRLKWRFRAYPISCVNKNVITKGKQLLWRRILRYYTAVLWIQMRTFWPVRIRNYCTGSWSDIFLQENLYNFCKFIWKMVGFVFNYTLIWIISVENLALNVLQQSHYELCTVTRKLFRWTGLKGRVRIQTKSLRIRNTAIQQATYRSFSRPRKATTGYH